MYIYIFIYISKTLKRFKKIHLKLIKNSFVTKRYFANYVAILLYIILLLLIIISLQVNSTFKNLTVYEKMLKSWKEK